MLRRKPSKFGEAPKDFRSNCPRPFAPYRVLPDNQGETP